MDVGWGEDEGGAERSNAFGRLVTLFGSSFFACADSEVQAPSWWTWGKHWIHIGKFGANHSLKSGWFLYELSIFT